MMSAMTLYTPIPAHHTQRSQQQQGKRMLPGLMFEEKLLMPDLVLAFTCSLAVGFFFHQAGC
jgi:hypothetical protein